MLTRARQETIATALTLTGQGESVKFGVTFFNRKQSELEAKIKDDAGSLNKTLLYLVESWESEYPLTEEGVAEMEDDRPGTVMAIFFAYHQARKVEKEKN